MARQGLQGRSPRRRRRGLTRPGKAAAPLADLLRRGFTAAASPAAAPDALSAPRIAL